MLDKAVSALGNLSQCFFNLHIKQLVQTARQTLNAVDTYVQLHFGKGMPIFGQL